MTENEILLALRNELKPIKADIQELKDELKPIKADIQELKANVKRIDLCIENEIRPHIQLLAENYVPAAQRYETAVPEMEGIKRDVDILKKVVAEHSQKLEKIAGN